MFKIVNDGKMPTRGSKYSACVDLYANEDVVIGAGETAIIPLGVAIDTLLLCSLCGESFLGEHYIQLEPRSSLRAKGLQVGTGIIDIDYPDELKLIVHNPVQLHRFVQNCENRTVLAYDDDVEFTIKKGDRIAQATFLQHKSYLFGIDSEKERTGGIGSTDE